MALDPPLTIRLGGPMERGWRLNPFLLIQRDINQLLEDVLLAGAGDSSIGRRVGDRMMPDMDVAATDKEIRVTAELPGVDEKEIKRGVEVSLGDDILTIEADKNPG